MSKYIIGQPVTCKREVAAYYSGYYGQPVAVFTPGTAGVYAGSAPKVNKRGIFHIVDYVDAGGKQQRVALDTNNIKRYGL